MEDLPQSQIHDSCKLVLPEGLKELMSDISREVLRAQPKNVYKFIANYLGILLEVRDKLFLAAKICDDTYKYATGPKLEEKLLNAGLNPEDAKKTNDIVYKHLKTRDETKCDLLLQLRRHTNLNEKQLMTVRDIINNTHHQCIVIHRIDETENLLKVVKSIRNHSSVSLAGSYVELPEHKPYCVYDDDSVTAGKASTVPSRHFVSREIFCEDYQLNSERESTETLDINKRVKVSILEAVDKFNKLYENVTEDSDEENDEDDDGDESGSLSELSINEKILRNDFED